MLPTIIYSIFTFHYLHDIVSIVNSNVRATEAVGDAHATVAPHHFRQASASLKRNIARIVNCIL